MNYQVFVVVVVVVVLLKGHHEKITEALNVL